MRRYCQFLQRILTDRQEARSHVIAFRRLYDFRAITSRVTAHLSSVRCLLLYAHDRSAINDCYCEKQSRLDGAALARFTILKAVCYSFGQDPLLRQKSGSDIAYNAPPSSL